MGIDRRDVPDDCTSFLFNPTTGDKIRPIRGGYRWVLRHLHEIQSVELSATTDGGAWVTWNVSHALAFRERWASFKLAIRFAQSQMPDENIQIYHIAGPFFS